MGGRRPFSDAQPHQFAHGCAPTGERLRIMTPALREEAACCVRVIQGGSQNDGFSCKVYGIGETNGEKEEPDSTGLMVVAARPGKRNCRWIPEIPHSLSQSRTITRPHGLVALIVKESPERSVLGRSERSRRQRAGGQESLQARSRTSHGGGKTMFQSARHRTPKTPRWVRGLITGAFLAVISATHLGCGLDYVFRNISPLHPTGWSFA